MGNLPSRINKFDANNMFNVSPGKCAPGTRCHCFHVEEITTHRCDIAIPPSYISATATVSTPDLSFTAPISAYYVSIWKERYAEGSLVIPALPPPLRRLVSGYLIDLEVQRSGIIQLLQDAFQPKNCLNRADPEKEMYCPMFYRTHLPYIRGHWDPARMEAQLTFTREVPNVPIHAF